MGVGLLFVLHALGDVGELITLFLCAQLGIPISLHPQFILLSYCNKDQTTMHGIPALVFIDGSHAGQTHPQTARSNRTPRLFFARRVAVALLVPFPISMLARSRTIKSSMAPRAPLQLRLFTGSSAVKAPPDRKQHPFFGLFGARTRAVLVAYRGRVRFGNESRYPFERATSVSFTMSQRKVQGSRCRLGLSMKCNEPPSADPRLS